MAELDPEAKETQPCLDLEIPVRVHFSLDRFPPSRTAFKLKEIARIERSIKQQWAEYERRSGTGEVVDGSIRSTLVLQPMDIRFDEYEPDMPREVSGAIRELIHENVRFSSVPLLVEVIPSLRIDRGLILGRIFSTVFGSKRLANGRFDVDLSSFQLDKLYLWCASLCGSDYGLLFSALAVNQVTTSLEWFGPIEKSADGTKEWWKWLAYGVFSGRARDYSALTSLSLTDVRRIQVADIEAFRAVLSSDHPEEMLLNLRRGRVAERDVTLKAGAWIRLKLSGNSYFTTMKIRLDAEVSHVRTLSDDGKSAWVNVLIPGYGRCRVQREDCLSNALPLGSERGGSGGLKSLRIQFEWDFGIHEGLRLFLETIGSSLERLVLIDHRGVFDVAMIVRRCPKLKKLCLGGSALELELTVNSKMLDEGTLRLDLDLNQIEEVLEYFSDTRNKLASNVRQLRVNLAEPESFRDYVAGPHHDRLNALLRMLETNQHLESLQVIVPAKYENYAGVFHKHHSRPTAKNLPLDLKAKLAFLSVTALQRPHEQLLPQVQLFNMDGLVISKIFEFTKTRQVIFRPIRWLH